MTIEFEPAFRHLLRAIVQEVALELVRESQIPNRPSMPQVNRAEDGLLLRSRDAAKRLGISERTLFKLTRSGSLPCVRIGQSVRYSVETIQKWIRETESTEPPQPKTVTVNSPQGHSANATAARPRPTPKLVANRRPAKKTAPISENKPKRVPNAPLRVSNNKTENEDRRNPFSDLLNEIGVSRSQLPPITNGDLRRIAEVDIATMHGWLYLNRELPAAALNKLREHYSKCVKDGIREKGEGQ